MNQRAPARAWLRWLLLAVFSCLNPKPDEQPLAAPGLDDVPPAATDEPSGAGTGSNQGPPLIGGDEGTPAPAEPGQQTTDGIADAGVPPGDAGASNGDAGSR